MLLLRMLSIRPVRSLLLIQLPDLIRLPNRHYTASLGLRSPAVREVMLLMVPRLISVATLQVNAVVTGIIANGFGTAHFRPSIMGSRS